MLTGSPRGSLSSIRRAWLIGNVDIVIEKPITDQRRRFLEIVMRKSFIWYRNSKTHSYTSGNIMMDGRGMYPEGWHPASPDCGLGPKFNLKKQNAKRYTRTQRPPRYYIIDFGESGFYDRQKPVQDKFNVRGCPENEGVAKSSEPFMTDLYFVGNTIRGFFVEVRCTGIHVS
jgi:hypothetical protein